MKRGENGKFSNKDIAKELIEGTEKVAGTNQIYFSVITKRKLEICYISLTISDRCFRSE
jgi:hypothetical protein